MTECLHQLVWYFEPPYRYRCLKCWKRLKISSGILLTDEQQKQWFNEHGYWPWDKPTLDYRPVGGGEHGTIQERQDAAMRLRR